MIDRERSLGELAGLGELLLEVCVKIGPTFVGTTMKTLDAEWRDAFLSGKSVEQAAPGSGIPSRLTTA